jgi:hypothetical protein
MSNDTGQDDKSKPSGRWRLPDQLPPLSGWSRRLFLVVWAMLFGFAAAIFVVSLPSAFAVPPAGPAVQVGLNLDDDAPGLVVRTVGDEAARSGIGRGDRLIAINGEAVSPDASGINRQLTGPASERVVIDLRSPDGTISQHVLSRDPENRRGFAQAGVTRQLYYAVGNFFQWLESLLVLVCAAILVARRLRDPLAPWASLMMIVVAVGTGGISLWLTDAGGVWGSISWWANRAPFLGMVLALVPNGSLRPRWTWAVLVAAPILTFVAMGLPALVGNIALGLLLLAGVLLVLHRYRSMAASERQQIRWVLFGLALALLMFAVGTACVWLGGQVGSYPASIWSRMIQGPAFMVCLILLVGAITMALLRYRLYDADVAISRSVALGALTLLLLGIFAGTEKLIEALGEQYFGESLGTLAGGIGAALAAVMIVPLHHRVNHWAEKRFQHQLVELRHNLPLLVNDLRATAGMDRLAAAVLNAVRRGVRARHAVLLVGDALAGARGIERGELEAWRAGWAPATGKGLDCNRADPLFPMRVPLEADGHGRVGWLLLGPRPDGSFYGKDEREALAAIADPVARAMEVVRVREAKVERDETRLAAIEQSLADALRRLSSLADPSAATTG